nr:MAG TPA: hypothetical protein [Caudoviricetes sp.]
MTAPSSEGAEGAAAPCTDSAQGRRETRMSMAGRELSTEEWRL